MSSLADRLLRTAAQSRRFLEKESRAETARFILSQRTADGGFHGRDEQSDLYYTFFAVASLRALGGSIPFFSLWKYTRSFGSGDGLDLVHLACLIQLRSAFPIFGNIVSGGSASFQRLEKLSANTSYDRFLKQMAADRLGLARLPSVPPPVVLTEPTPNLAAAAILNSRERSAAIPALLKRACLRGGFGATEQQIVPDLLSTATALFALVQAGADLDSIRRPCLEYIESLWRDSGGFAGHVADEFEDVEYTFYALLSIGSLVK